MAEKYWYGGITNHEGDWAWDTSKEDTIDAAAAVDNGGGLVGIPVTGTIFVAGESVVIAGTTNYNGTYTLDETTSENEIVITETYEAETFGGTETVTSNTGSNWKLVSDGSDTTKPADADIVYFNGRAYESPEGKMQNCTLNVDEAGTGTPNLDGLFISAGYNGTIGGSALPLEINCDGEDVIIDGACTLYLNLSAGTGADAGCSRLVLNNKNASVYIESNLNNASNVCLYSTILALQGNLSIQDDCAITEVICADSRSNITCGSGVGNEKTSAVCNITAVDGEIEWNSKIGTIDIFNCRFFWGQEDMTAVSGYTCNKLIMYSSSGVFTWQLADTSGSVLKEFELYSGRIISSRLLNTGYKKTIGTGTETCYLWPDAEIDLDSGTNAVLLASGSVLESRGGRLVASAGSIIEW